MENASESDQSKDEFVRTGSNFSLIVLTPSKKDLHLLDEDYSEKDALARCLRVHELVADNAVAIVAVPIRALPVIANKLLPLCGFDRISHVLLAKAPAEADVIANDAIIVAERGGEKLVSVPKDFWPSGDGRDVLSIATEMVPKSENRLHVFAKSSREGWESITPCSP